MLRVLAALLTWSSLVAPVAAHDPETGQASAIRNAGVMVEVGDTKIMFDPLFRRGILGLDEALAESIINGAAPYDGVDAVFVSHAHYDHFSAPQLNAMMAAQPNLRIYAPAQAVQQMRDDAGWNEVFASRVEAVAKNHMPTILDGLNGSRIEAFNIPHSGWPDSNTDVENVMFRVTLAPGQRVLHTGDAEHQDELYAPYAEALASARSGLAFVPFWFFLEPDGEAIIANRLNSEKAIGVHLETSVPPPLAESGADYFDELGESRAIPNTGDR